jgi:large subunit ribosomal protein L15
MSFRLADMKLSTLSPVPGSRKQKKRLGRGEGSGLGKTGGKGGKGQTARTGGTVARHFEGGQMPLYRRLPKLGFRSFAQTSGRKDTTLVTLEFLNRFEDGDVVSRDSISYAKRDSRIKVVCTGEITKRLTVKLPACSKAARLAIEERGGVFEEVE